MISARSPEEGLRRLQADDVDLVIQDMNFSADTTSGEEGETLFRAIRAQHTDLPVILLTAWTHLSVAVELVKAGAADYLSKPWDDSKLAATVANLLELGQATRELARRARRDRQLRRELEQRYDLRGIVFADAATERVISLACQVARADVPVLITGANGTGKERIAEIIQANSAARDGPFVTLNCGALPAELIEAELFGADASAYTGATRSREGKFEAADGGTLFLDEIGNLPPAGQVKLLRVLETGKFARVGSARERQVKVRVISATNADLQAMIRDGRFREDLYYRLNVIQIHLPPLAERTDDIVPLAEHFLAMGRSPSAAGAMDGQERPSGRTLSAPALAALRAHMWPGNVRELKNAMQRSALLASGREIGVADLGLPAAIGARSTTTDHEPDREAIEVARARGWRDRAGRGGSRAEPAGVVSPHGTARHRARMNAVMRDPMNRIYRRSSLAGRYALATCALVVFAIALAVSLESWFDSPVLAAAVTALVLIPLTLALARRQIAPALSLFRALGGTVTSYRDSDFSFGLAWPRNDELGDLVDAHNALGDALRDQRLALVQRELLLDTMVQNTPVAMLLVDSSGRVVYSNLAARKLLNDGRKLEGSGLAQLLQAASEPLREAIERGGLSVTLVIPE